MTGGIQLKSASEIDALYRANQVVAEALSEMMDKARPGVTTAEMDEIGRLVLEKRGAKSAFLHYPHSGGGRPFPATVCASPNEVIVHGIPSRDVVMNEGDILSLDFGAILDGWVGDSAVTVPIGTVTPEAMRLIKTTQACLDAAIDMMRVGCRLGDIGYAVQSVAEAEGYGVVTEFVGHGIGRRMHEPPPVANVGRKGTGERLRPGMVFAIEPMINQGTGDVEVLSDGWTAVTGDRKLSAHIEHSVAVTEDGPRVLSVRHAR